VRGQDSAAKSFDGRINQDRILREEEEAALKERAERMRKISKRLQEISETLPGNTENLHDEQESAQPLSPQGPST